MNAIERIGLLMLFGAVVFGAWRTASGFTSPEPPDFVRSDTAPGSLPGEEVLASAIRTDLLAAELRSKPPSRSPFVRRTSPAHERGVRPGEKSPIASPPAVALGERAPTVPRVVLVVRDATGPRTVLSLGETKSGPLAIGDSFANWTVHEIGVEKVYLEKKGIRLSLPIP